MNKRITSLLLCFVMVFAMLATAVPAFAVTGKSTYFKMTADKTEASPGDTVTYTAYIGPVDGLAAIKFKLKFPSGLTYVEGSGKAVDGLQSLLNSAKAEFTESTKVFIVGSSNYTSTEDTALMKFQCKVNDDATGSQTVEFYIDDPDNLFDQDYDNIDFITKPFRRHFTRKVLVVGSASGGKTTLVKDLARTYNAPCSLEYAREYQEKYNVRDDELDTNDYIHLLTDQYAQTAEIIDNGQHSWLIFADTNSTVTKVYIDYYLKENISQEEFDLLDRLYQVTQAREKWDLIFVILPKSNYVDDGSRDMTMADNRTRDWFTKHLLDLLSPFKDKIVILVENCDSDSFFADNYHYAKKTIKERLHIEI